MTAARAGSGPVAVVLAGGGARGAYEAGALSVLVPELERRGERPRIIVGTSVGALNGAFLAAAADLPAAQLAEQAQRVWSEMHYSEVLSPILSVASAERAAGYVGEFLGLPRARLVSLLSPAPLRRTLLGLVSFERLAENVSSGAVDAAAVVATSAATGRSAVFHSGGVSPPADEKRAIDYVPTNLTEEHVLASAAIPTVFPAVRVPTPAAARGWYVDGGTRLNTPIKPALALGAERILVVALNSIAPAPARLATQRQPDALQGAAQLLQAVLVDPLVNDVQTLAGINARLARHAAGQDRVDVGDWRRVPYIFIAPQRRDTIGKLARKVFHEHYGGALGLLRSPSLRLLGRAVAGARDAAHGELLSYLLFAPEFGRALLDLGRADAQRWLAGTHDDGPWALAPLHAG